MHDQPRDTPPATASHETGPSPAPSASRWVRTAADARAVAEGCWFDEDAALHVVAFFEQFLRHSKGRWAGEPFTLMAWQREELIYPIFGWKRPDGTRRYRTAYIEVPKKSGKSSLCAGISLYLLLADGEPGAEVYNAAVDREQAGIVFGEAANMVESSPHLRRRLVVTRSRKTIAYPAGRGVYKALSAEVGTKEGLNIHGLVFDEFHAQANRQMWDALRYGGAARQQPLFVIITTAGYDRTSVCWEKHEYAREVAEGSIEDTSFFGFVTAAGSEDDWSTEATWRKANPSFGITFAADDMRRAFLEVQNSPANENLFRRYRLNMWTEQDVRFVSMAKWDEGAVPLRPLDGRACYAGLDLASTSDITALVLLFPALDGTYDVLPIFWIPEERAVERERKDGVPYTQWIREGFIRTTRGDMIDYDTIRRDVNALVGQIRPWSADAPKVPMARPLRKDAAGPSPAKGASRSGAGVESLANPRTPEEHLAALIRSLSIEELAIDRLFQGAQLATQLADDGLTVVPFGMGFYSMAAPTAELDRLIRTAALRHGNNPALRWMASNVAVETDAAGNFKPSKRKSKEKIDGMVALIMALGRAMVQPVVDPSRPVIFTM